MAHRHLHISHLTVRVPREAGGAAPGARRVAEACAREILRSAAAAGPVPDSAPAAALAAGERVAAEIRRRHDRRGRA